MKGPKWLMSFVWAMTLSGIIPAMGQQPKGGPSLAGHEDYSKAQQLHRQLKFDSAILYYRIFRESSTGKSNLREVEKRILECKSGKKLVMSPREFIIENLGPAINSRYEDYAPVTNGEGNLLVFTSRRPEGNLNSNESKEGKYFEDIFFSKKENAQWSLAMNIGAPVNTLFHDSDLALSADGKQLFLYTDANEGDILSSRWVNGRWTVPQRLPWPINTTYHESSVSVTMDGKKLFVASERPGGFGGSDIYVFEKRPTGQWGPAINLGPSVNTEWDEDSPFIDYDGSTLFFSSTGHNSMGGHDIFRTSVNNTGWTAAENLGYPINTPGHDSYFASTRDGKGAYYSSVREGGFGDEDIYYIILPREFVREEIVPKAEEGQGKIHGKNFPDRSLVVYFLYGSHELTPVENEKLNAFLGEIKNSGEYKIRIDGHTDSTGIEKVNQDLSRARAQSVKSYFESKGIQGDLIEIAAWGASRPVAANTEEKSGRELNRRVEVRVIHN